MLILIQFDLLAATEKAAAEVAASAPAGLAAALAVAANHDDDEDEEMILISWVMGDFGASLEFLGFCILFCLF
jgi:hypothetical protein